MTPYERFKQFVSAILTVSKEDIQKVEDEAKELATPEACEQADPTRAAMLELDAANQRKKAANELAIR
jgi:hypothetical protein